jgi:hypothetical protein
MERKQTIPYSSPHWGKINSILVREIFNHLKDQTQFTDVERSLLKENLLSKFNLLQKVSTENYQTSVDYLVDLVLTANSAKKNSLKPTA